jgi:membrane protein involved in colicin uptake
VLTGVGAGFAAMLFLCTVAGIAGSGGQKSNSETAKTADSHVVSQASSTSPNAVSDAKRKAAEDKAAADKAAADKAAADKAAADKAAADKAAAAAQQPLTSSFANFSCDQLAAEAARMPKNGNPSVSRLSEAGLDPETLSLRASMEFILREFDQRGA